MIVTVVEELIIVVLMSIVIMKYIVITPPILTKPDRMQYDHELCNVGAVPNTTFAQDSPVPLLL